MPWDRGLTMHLELALLNLIDIAKTTWTSAVGIHLVKRMRKLRSSSLRFVMQQSPTGWNEVGNDREWGQDPIMRNVRSIIITWSERCRNHPSGSSICNTNGCRAGILLGIQPILTPSPWVSKSWISSGSRRAFPWQPQRCCRCLWTLLGPFTRCKSRNTSTARSYWWEAASEILLKP